MRPIGHIRQRTPDSWELRYTLGTDPATGKRRTATITVRGSRKEAEKERRHCGMPSVIPTSLSVETA